jgi:tetratricopeptide (TPR) repeat protein
MEIMLNKAAQAFNDNKIDESLELISIILHSQPEHVDALILRARIFQKQQIWGNALNDLNRILELEPDNKIANSLKIMIIDIIRFWNKDSFNP